MDYFHRFQLKPPLFIDFFISLKIKAIVMKNIITIAFGKPNVICVILPKFGWLHLRLKPDEG